MTGRLALAEQERAGGGDQFVELVVVHPVAGVYNIATLPAYRRRGLGEALTWHAVSRGAEAGCTIASLQTSEMGESIYTRMGFRRWASYPTYGRGEEAGG